MNGTALDPQRVQRRTVWVLSSAQLLSGVGSGASLSVGSLLAVQLSGSNAWAGSVTTTMTLAPRPPPCRSPDWPDGGAGGPPSSRVCSPPWPAPCW